MVRTRGGRDAMRSSRCASQRYRTRNWLVWHPLDRRLTGRTQTTTLPDGSGLITLQDTEGHTARIARSLASAETISPTLPDVQLDYERLVDQPGRLTRTRDALGVTSNYRYNDVGQIAEITNALGAASKFGYDAAGQLAQRTDAADSVSAATTAMRYDNAGNAINITAANGVATVRRYDEFGQKIMEADPDHGVTLFRYDAAGRMVARIDETMVTTRFTFDHANRMLAVGAYKQPNLTQYEYRGRQLVNMVSTPDGKLEHATERAAYERDALGQVIRETRWLADVSSAPGAGANASHGLTFITVNGYDNAGRLINQTLPDGHRLQYRFAADDESGSRPGHRPGQLDAILFDDRVVVTDIEQTIAGGMTGYTMGNGLRQKIRLDRRGRIEELQVSRGSPNGFWKRIVALFSGGQSATSEIYKQVNRYDKNDRIIQIARHSESANADNTMQTRTEQYAYDAMNRMTEITENNGIVTTFKYDKGGNRIAESVKIARGDIGRTNTQDFDLAERTFQHAAGSNRLIAVAQKSPADLPKKSANSPMDTLSSVTTGAEQTIQNAWFYHPTGVQLAQLQWLSNGISASRRISYNSGKRPVAVYENDLLIARYYYNSRGERIAKTSYPKPEVLTRTASTPSTPQGVTTYSVYRDQRLTVETNAAGRITAHYVYLLGKPVAKIEMPANTSVIDRFWAAVRWSAKSDSANPVAGIYAIITDQLGTPQQVRNEQQELMWQGQTMAFGEARVTYTRKRESNALPFEMNLRLPSQIFDKETRMNYNHFRDYDPQTGRYTEPDPVDLNGGSNPYVYVSNNPLTKIDPPGLYQIDVHYYMTFFLAIMAGINESRARQIALAAQFIDDNSATSPTPKEIAVSSMTANQAALARYHFVQYGYDIDRTMPQTLYKFAFGRDTDEYTADRIKNPGSPKLARLLNASEFAKTDPKATCQSRTNCLANIFMHSKTRSRTETKRTVRIRLKLQVWNRPLDWRHKSRLHIQPHVWISRARALDN